MSLVIAGIDEAGYGPTLGPLCVGLCVFRVPTPPAQGVPDLWSLLSRAVCVQPGRGGKPDAKGRIAIGDSKQLKLSNQSKTVHPLVHLERAVLSFASLLPGASAMPRDDLELFRLLGASLGTPAQSRNGSAVHHHCYASPARPLPVAHSTDQLSIAISLLRGTLASTGIVLEALCAATMGEADFNAIIRETGNKGETTCATFGKHLRTVWQAFATTSEQEDHRVGVVCDRLGGRASYRTMLEREISDASVEVLEETDRRSRYVLTSRHGSPQRRMGVTFLTESEQHYLPVALASMTAKYVRELAMLRFNQHWNSLYRELHGKDLAPTAGYATDARRWLAQVGEDVLGRADRDALVRIA